jgi:GNAT superfamily N-acetyltransferase
MTKLVPFIVKVRDFNLIFRNKKMMSELRSLTLHKDSGMNSELNDLIAIALRRKVKAKVILGYFNLKLVSWALVSKEPSNFFKSCFGKRSGVLFEVFVDPRYRRKGIGSTLFKKAKVHARPYKLDTCSWDSVSSYFYSKMNELEK